MSLAPNRATHATPPAGALVPFPSPAPDGSSLARVRWRAGVLSPSCALTPAQRLVALAVEQHAGTDDSRQFVCFVSVETLAAETGTCEKTARAALAVVVEAGYLARERGKAVYRGGKRQGRESRTSYTYALVTNREAFLEKRNAQRAANLASADTRRAEKAHELAVLRDKLARLHAAHALGKVDADTLAFDGARLQRTVRDIERYILGSVPVAQRKVKRGVSTLANKRRERSMKRTGDTLAAATPAPVSRAASRQTEPACECGCKQLVVRHNGTVYNATAVGLPTATRHVCQFYPDTPPGA